MDGRPLALHYLERIGALSRDREVTRQRYDSASTPLSPLARAAATWIGWARARGVDSAPGALMQIGSWYDPGRLPGLRPEMRCSYHDGNLAVFLKRPDSRVDRHATFVRRAWAYERRVYDRMDLIMPRSEWLRRSFIEDFHQDPDKVVAVGAGANLEAVPSPPERNFDRPRLLFVGKDFERKGGPLVLHAFERVRAAVPDAELWIAGPSNPPPDRPGVRFFGQIMRDTPEGDALMKRLYSEATAFVMPSLFEPWGTVFLEAMAYRLPCVGANCCAMPELVEDEESGYTVTPGEVDELADRLHLLATDPDRARAMGEAGYRRFTERFTWDRVADRIAGEIASRIADAA